jgi:hypothetical protein
LRNGSACLSRDPPNRHSLPKTEEINQKNNNQGDQDGIQGLHNHAILTWLSRAIPPTERCAFIPHFGIFVKSHFPPTMFVIGQPDARRAGNLCALTQTLIFAAQGPGPRCRSFFATSRTRTAGQKVEACYSPTLRQPYEAYRVVAFSIDSEPAALFARAGSAISPERPGSR